MLFIHPMWVSESQRIGKKKCTPTGYGIHVFSELVGFAGILLLVFTSVHAAYHWLVGTFDGAFLLWILASTVALAVVSEALYQCSWLLAMRKGFEYDYERDEASWTQAGQRRTHKWPG